MQVSLLTSLFKLLSFFLILELLFLPTYLFAQESVRIAATPETTPLAQHLLRVAWEGQAPPLKLIPNLDGALDALHDQAVDGAILMSSIAPTATAIPIARTTIIWTTRSDTRSFSDAEWTAFLKGEFKDRPLQLCLRALPDQLEKEWIRLHPQDALYLQEARDRGRALIFYDEQELLQHLMKRPDAITLFDEGRLRLFGAPLAPIQIENSQKVSVLIWYLQASSKLPLKERSKALLEWSTFLQNGTHLTWLSDLGWHTP